MDVAEGLVPGPRPAQSPAGENQHLPDDDEQQEQRMDDADEIGPETVIHRPPPLVKAQDSAKRQCRAK